MVRNTTTKRDTARTHTARGHTARGHTAKTKPSPQRPGERLLEVLDELQISQAELCARMGRSRKLINEIIKGKAGIAPETALQLEYALGQPASFWNGLETDYQDSVIRDRYSTTLAKQLAWLQELPVQAMIDAKWLDERETDLEQAQELLAWFGVATPEQWRELYETPQAGIRRSPAEASDPGALAAWLRAGEKQAYEMETPPYDRKTFLKSLRKIRGLTRFVRDDWQDEVMKLSIRSGVAVAFARELPGLRVAGASRWLSPRKALIQLSMLHRTLADAWFAFFHEAAHILLHGRKLVFVEGVVEGKPSRDDVLEEIEADQFAANFLIPKGAIEKLAPACENETLNEKAIRLFARKQRISAGIVVIRLQRLGWIEPTEFNGLKIPLGWAPPGTYVEL